MPYRSKDKRGPRKSAKEWNLDSEGFDRRFTPAHVLRRQHDEELRKKASEVERDSGDSADESGESEAKQKAINRRGEPGQLPDPASSSSEEEEEEDDNLCKPKGVEHLIGVEKLNNVDLTTSAQAAAAPTAGTKSIALNKKERALARYQKLHAELKTDQAQADLARLAVIKKQREEAAQRREAENKARESAKRAARLAALGKEQ